MTRATIALIALLASCVQPKPVPTVQDAGGPFDLFTGKIVNCRLPVVAVERDSALGDVRACLMLSGQLDVAECLVRQATNNYTTASVACVARDAGARANAAYLAGATDPRERLVADAARVWIAGHRLGFISVEVAP